MATAVRTSESVFLGEVGGEQRVILRDIGWDGYEAILAMRGERPIPRLAYYRGSLELMSPGYRHETMAERLGNFVTILVMESRIDFSCAGSTTLRLRAREAGVEGDKTFYIAHEAIIRANDAINLEADPPPDLAVEVEITSPLADREAIYAALNVPELWVYRRDNRAEAAGVRVLHLGADGCYAEAPSSLSFPFLETKDIDDWVRRPKDVSETEWLLQLRDWVRETLAPRREGEGARAGSRP